MNLVIWALQAHVPQSMKKQGLKQLFDLTANAFRAKAPDVSGLSFEQALRQYALFTKDESEKAIRQGQSGDLQAIRDRLYQGARQMGQQLRTALRVNTPQKAAAAFELLYRMIGIESSARFPGEVQVTECFFSRFYSGEVCRLMSPLDAGIAAGLSGGGSLAFDRRITEGDRCCRARFDLSSLSGGDCT